ncbi:MAG TPA: hypothetical protein VHW00_23325 [Thermoanaerobaculia bacterium]|nr:hypothetical protein [Thermoanaerobaculia bacterium]
MRETRNSGDDRTEREPQLRFAEPATPPAAPDGERGAALVVVIFAATLILLLLMTALIMTRMSGRALARQLASQGQATNAASAGLNEGLSYFVHQPPTSTVFDPKVDSGGVCTHIPPHSPLVFESEEPALGIVRSFEVSAPGRVWARYELRRPAAGVPCPVVDISVRRGKTQAGTIWRLASEGIVYVRNNASVAPNVSPNYVLARRTMAVDVQRLGLKLPGNAAISTRAGNAINIIRPSRIQGGSATGAFYPNSTGTPSGNGTITGNPARSATANLADYPIDAVFGVSQSELVAMADLVVDDESELPAPLPDMSLIVIRGNATFNATRKLTGSGVLVVLGNLILNPNSDTYYSGLIWVGGNFVLTPPGVINGAVIANSNAQIAGGSEVAEINYDAAILNQIRQQMGNFLFSRSPWIVTRPAEECAQ